MKRLYYATHASFRCGSDFSMIVHSTGDKHAMRAVRKRLSIGKAYSAGDWIVTTPVFHERPYGDTRSVGIVHKADDSDERQKYDEMLEDRKR